MKSRKTPRTYSFKFTTEIFLARCGDVEVEVSATVDDNGDDVTVQEVRLNGDEVSDQIGDRNIKIIDEKAADEAYDQLGELRACANEAEADARADAEMSRRDGFGDR